MEEKLIISRNYPDDILDTISCIEADRYLILTDNKVNSLQSDFIEKTKRAFGASEIIVVPEGEETKSVSGLLYIWESLSRLGATRKSVLICVGGGMITDLGGFAASTFKRGIRHINVPTTLLCAADASVGGKTGINIGNLKNEVGTFAKPLISIICGDTFSTLSPLQIADGMAEIIKMAMLSDSATLANLYQSCAWTDMEEAARLAIMAARLKKEITDLDPEEKGLRRVLNLGHTVGHAYESLAMQRGLALTHGCAVAYGLLDALRLSERYAGLESGESERYSAWLNEHYSPLPFDVAEVADEIERMMRHDKKNIHTRGEERVRFVLLRSIGDPEVKSLSTHEWKWATIKSR